MVVTLEIKTGWTSQQLRPLVEVIDIFISGDDIVIGVIATGEIDQYPNLRSRCGGGSRGQYPSPSDEVVLAFDSANYHP